MSTNHRLFASKLKFLTGIQSSPVADSNLQDFVDVFTLPAADGTSDQVLKTDGSGVITFGTVSAGGIDSATTTSLITTTVDSAYVTSKLTTSPIYTRTTSTATAGQTVFSATYTPDFVDVFVNGIKIHDSDDFIATNGTSITTNVALSLNDVVEIVSWAPTAIVDVVKDIIQEGNTSVEAVDTGTGGYVAVTVDGTETARFDSAGDFQFNSGYGSVATAYGCRAWVNFNGTNTVAIRASGNVPSITDINTGVYALNFATAMPDAHYSLAGAAGPGSANQTQFVLEIDIGNFNTSSANVNIGVTSNGSTTGTDASVITVMIVR